jgi:hypothetical protein
MNDAELEEAARAMVRLLRDTVPRSTARGLDTSRLAEIEPRYRQLWHELIQRYPAMLKGVTVRPLSTISDERQLGYAIQDLQHFLRALPPPSEVSIPGVKITREGVFLAGSDYDAVYQIGEILAEAKHNIKIIDGYIDRKVIRLLTSKGTAVTVDILTKRLKPATREEAEAFNTQYHGLSIRTCDAFHDRFIIIDDTIYYHFGSSIKDAGRRGFMFSRVEEPVVIQALSAAWNREWQRANPEVP